MWAEVRRPLCRPSSNSSVRLRTSQSLNVKVWRVTGTSNFNVNTYFQIVSYTHNCLVLMHRMPLKPKELSLDWAGQVVNINILISS